MLPTKFRIILLSGSIMSAHFVRIHLQTWRPQAILISDWSISKNLDRDEMSILYREPSIDGSYQVSVHSVEGF
jgi:hypothetical protein